MSKEEDIEFYRERLRKLDILGLESKVETPKELGEIVSLTTHYIADHIQKTSDLTNKLFFLNALREYVTKATVRNKGDILLARWKGVSLGQKGKLGSFRDEDHRQKVSEAIDGLLKLASIVDLDEFESEHSVYYIVFRLEPPNSSYWWYVDYFQLVDNEGNIEQSHIELFKTKTSVTNAELAPDEYVKRISIIDQKQKNELVDMSEFMEDFNIKTLTEAEVMLFIVLITAATVDTEQIFTYLGETIFEKYI